MSPNKTWVQQIMLVDSFSRSVLRETLQGSRGKSFVYGKILTVVELLSGLPGEARLECS